MVAGELQVAIHVIQSEKHRLDIFTNNLSFDLQPWARSGRALLGPRVVGMAGGGGYVAVKEILPSGGILSTTLRFKLSMNSR